MRGASNRRLLALLALVLLLGSVASVALAPRLMPPSYSVREHSVSESAAQGVEGAWLARLGLTLLGFGVLVLAGVQRWGRWGTVAHRGYGVAAITTAVFSDRPWDDVPFDSFEDLLHSVGSAGVGVAFTLGVLLVAFRRGPHRWPTRIFDGLALVAALVVPMVMFNAAPEMAGLVQRIMFGVAYLWYGLEAIEVLRKPPQG